MTTISCSGGDILTRCENDIIGVYHRGVIVQVVGRGSGRGGGGGHREPQRPKLLVRHLSDGVYVVQVVDVVRQVQRFQELDVTSRT